jgi:hypothetical protein
LRQLARTGDVVRTGEGDHDQADEEQPGDDGDVRHHRLADATHDQRQRHTGDAGERGPETSFEAGEDPTGHDRRSRGRERGRHREAADRNPVLGVRLGHRLTLRSLEVLGQVPGLLLEVSGRSDLDATQLLVDGHRPAPASPAYNADARSSLGRTPTT